MASAEDSAEHHDAFHDLLYLLLFLVAAWAAGKAASRLGAPPLCGEIILGALFGPPVGNAVPHAEALRLVGEVGLVLMVRRPSAALAPP
jgi:Kef-type K+ transport system membrane component KefB